MLFTQLYLLGSFLVTLKPHQDERGSFTRSFCQSTFEDAGLKLDIVQTNISFNHYQGTLRGMHFQADPFGEVKLIRCTKGAIFDVIVDIRPESNTFGQWATVTLTEDNNQTLYIPTGFAHGFQTLRDSTEVLYYMSTTYKAEATQGILWRDPALAIEWPHVPKRIISKKDNAFPLLKEILF
jgi:dTDP-4-dehydrorhamnose 3,5-epimerase